MLRGIKACQSHANFWVSLEEFGGAGYCWCPSGELAVGLRGGCSRGSPRRTSSALPPGREAEVSATTSPSLAWEELSWWPLKGSHWEKGIVPSWLLREAAPQLEYPAGEEAIGKGQGGCKTGCWCWCREGCLEGQAQILHGICTWEPGDINRIPCNHSGPAESAPEEFMTV